MGVTTLTRRGVFVDRDGVINHLWLNLKTGELESPIQPSDFQFRDGVTQALAYLRQLGYHLFLVSNQPSAAKGKCRLEDLEAVHQRFVQLLRDANVWFDNYYYSYRHPAGVVPELSGDAYDRKPNPYFINLAIGEYSLARRECWMIGDRDSDIECGQRAGIRTIRVESEESISKGGRSVPDFSVHDLAAAACVIAGKRPKLIRSRS